MTSKAARGVKRTCQHCKKRFYDLNRDPIICPYCEEEFKLEKPSEEVLAREKAEAERLAAEERRAAEEAEKKKAAASADPDLTVVDDDDLADLEDVEDVPVIANDDATDAFLPDDDDDEEDVTELLGDTAPKLEDDM